MGQHAVGAVVVVGVAAAATVHRPGAGAHLVAGSAGHEAQLRVLEDEPDPRRDLAGPEARRVAHGLSRLVVPRQGTQPDRPGVGSEQPRHGEQQAGLAGAVRADQGDPLAGSHRDRHPVDGEVRAALVGRVCDPYMGCLQQ